MTTTQTTQLFTWATEYKTLIDSGGTFLAEQSPLVVQEMLFAPWLSFFISGSIAVVLIVALLLLYRCFIKSTSPNVFHMVALCSTIILCTFFIPSAAIDFLHVLEAHFTPRLYIMEQLAGMVM